MRHEMTVVRKYEHSGTVKKGIVIDETCHIESLHCLQRIVGINKTLTYLRAICERIASVHLLARQLKYIKRDSIK